MDEKSIEGDKVFDDKSKHCTEAKGSMQLVSITDFQSVIKSRTTSRQASKTSGIRLEFASRWPLVLQRMRGIRLPTN